MLASVLHWHSAVGLATVVFMPPACLAFVLMLSCRGLFKTVLRESCRFS